MTEVQMINDELPSLNSNTRQLRLVGWLPPEEGVVKINTDGSFKGSTGMTAARGVKRDVYGSWIGSFVMNCGPSNV